MEISDGAAVTDEVDGLASADKAFFWKTFVVLLSPFK